MKKIISFLAAGGVGFAVDVGVLMALLHWTSVDAFSARLVAIACALTCTWMLNRTFTFARSTHSFAVEGARYWSVGLSTALANYGIYLALLLLVPDIRPVFALVISSGCATILSYTGYSRFVFRQ